MKNVSILSHDEGELQMMIVKIYGQCRVLYLFVSYLNTLQNIISDYHCINYTYFLDHVLTTYVPLL